MLAFEISVNGKRLCPFGTDNALVVSTALSWTRHQGRVCFNIGGIVNDGTNDHFEWKTPQIDVGDEVLVRLVDVDSIDAYDNRYSPSLRASQEDLNQEN